MAKDNEGRIVSQSLLSSLPTFLLTRSSSSYRENIWLVNYYYLWFILLYVPPCFMWTRLLICSEDIKSDLCPHFPKWITNGWRACPALWMIKRRFYANPKVAFIWKHQDQLKELVDVKIIILIHFLSRQPFWRQPEIDLLLFWVMSWLYKRWIQMSHSTLRSNSVTRQVSFNRTKISRKCQTSKVQMRHFE